jgi:hypothetical protein
MANVFHQAILACSLYLDLITKNSCFLFIAILEADIDETHFRQIVVRSEQRHMSSGAESRAYGKLRDVIEHRGGTMLYRREGYRYGAWEISLDGKTVVIAPPISLCAGRTGRHTQR